ncbi:MAG: hypothetical protein JXR70_10270 [Spirochaetales bacterium]|nr:hypothetical protein [Spirochaetales bacterium]
MGLTGQERKEKEVSLLFDLYMAMEQSMEIKDIMLPILQVISEYMDMEKGTITLVNKDTGKITIEAASGLSEDQKKRADI